MIIINADDWGGNRAATDAALYCYRGGGITSVTAMVFMDDSARAAELARDADIPVGLHLNLSQPFTGDCGHGLLREYHNRIVRFMTRSRYSFLMYNPALRRAFQYIYQAQADEFLRLYGRSHTHVDGHHHLHLCANMLIDGIIPPGEKVRRNFVFWPDEKGALNRELRSFQDRWLQKKYRLADFFVALPQCLHTGRMTRVIELAKVANVEVMAHPVRPDERDYLLSKMHWDMLQEIDKGTYASI